MKKHFAELFEYNYHFNQKLSDVFNLCSDKTSEKAIKLFSHILNAHHIWNSRIEMKQPSFGVWDTHPVQNMKSVDQKNYERSLQLIDEIDLNEMVNYSNSRGQAFSSSNRDILFHLINHSTYHRGQIAMEFKREGLEPLNTDYIFFKR